MTDLAALRSWRDKTAFASWPSDFQLRSWPYRLQLANLTMFKGMGVEDDTLAEHQPRMPRPDIVDRNGVVLATDIAVASLYADPRKIIDVDEAVEILTATVPDLDAKALRAKLMQPSRAFVWLKRQVAPEERDAIYNLGIPGVGFVNESRRVYPMGRLAAHMLGYVDLDSKGIAGIEKYLDDQGALYTASLAEAPARRQARRRSRSTRACSMR